MAQTPPQQVRHCDHLARNFEQTFLHIFVKFIHERLLVPNAA